MSLKRPAELDSFLSLDSSRYQVQVKSAPDFRRLVHWRYVLCFHPSILCTSAQRTRYFAPFNRTHHTQHSSIQPFTTLSSIQTSISSAIAALYSTNLSFFGYLNSSHKGVHHIFLSVQDNYAIKPTMYNAFLSSLPYGCFWALSTP